ncbi:MAG: rhodanese-related sulfurtransferase [Chloroflexi bacterium]|nr:rhodanese-related sulfurtransferase [Chloroflexota bacterium]
MSHEISAESLAALFESSESFALIDVREAGEYNSSHIPGASLIPRRELEFRIAASAPFTGAHIVLCDDDGRRAALAAGTLESLGYSNVSVLARGINGWASLDLPTEWGVNVPSKDFGEKVEVVHHVPEIDATELHSRIERGDKLVILDTRTPEEYRRFCIPGGRSVPGGELALRITDITAELDPDTTVIVNCAGRTRSIIGTRVLQRMGRDNVLGLKNGTSGWVLAGYELESGADRVDLPEPSSEGLAAAEDYADRLAREDGVRYLDIPALQQMMERGKSETVYFVDVRTTAEYTQGHIPGFRWFPGGQAVQRSDDVAVVRNTPIIFACDDKVRSTIAASWYRQLGHDEVYAVAGGVDAWAAAGQELEKGGPAEPVLGLDKAREGLELHSPEDLATLLFDNVLTELALELGAEEDDDEEASEGTVVLFVDSSADFAAGHVPGARWAPRGWLELQVGNLAPSLETPVVVTCRDGRNSVLAAATLKGMGYAGVSALEGGVVAWLAEELPVETGLSGVMSPPTDLVASGPDRNYADMMNYLRWETALGEKYAT